MGALLLRWVILPLAATAVISKATKKTGSTSVLPTSYSGSAFNDPYPAPPASGAAGGISIYQGAKVALMAVGILFAYRIAREVIK